MEGGHFLATVVGAVASCVAVHIGLGIFGLDLLLHSWSSQVGVSLGFVDPTMMADVHAGHSHFGDAFMDASTGVDPAALPMAPGEVPVASGAEGLPDFDLG